jgi:glycine/D-amino acid oxidase-like deaminating enzyme
LIDKHRQKGDASFFGSWGGMYFEVAILGAGAAGVALADTATRSGFRCVLVESPPFKGFASLRNQSWLHSGALYATGHGSGSSSTVEYCRQGWHHFQRIQVELNAKLISTEAALMVFSDTELLAKSISNLNRHRLFAEHVEQRKLSTLEPVLGDAHHFVGGVLTSDVTVDTATALNLLMRRVGEGGGRFYRCGEAGFSELNIERKGALWSIGGADGTLIEAKNLVLACGVLIPQIAAKILGKAFGGAIWKCAVLALTRLGPHQWSSEQAGRAPMRQCRQLPHPRSATASD